ncbi:hypothetical protein NLK61_25285 [Pseudomonas fuscovaginae UPB0736]|uniref:Ribulose-5-phosphate 4-epimerase/Fuculose-1-phosphate aldolase n=1 Tax=Pseudomonas asplenii TaxID=53407 RepID=A0A1H1XCP0_9PSED|nr:MULTISPECIES: hypothetical protein [Pseudomonas]UUQ64484.1 hypothetical protein NLK61_25285 [Pseudomonas fuscovaginae UPB0736]SDT07035.1 Ribulose-5-phosphate 4-epimerase/Fuculose-1-phosphate aldolase [Pseudomonas asplenii]
MNTVIRQQWLDLRQRLANQVVEPDASFSIRVPGGRSMLVGRVLKGDPQTFDWQAPAGDDAQVVTHAAIYRARPDVGAILMGGGTFGFCLAGFGGQLPVLFDEQARHLGHMGPPAGHERELPRTLKAGGNSLLIRGIPVCLGTTSARMALNAELFEKCAKAYTLAKATGKRISQLPWLIDFIANGRLLKDEKRAAQAYASGQLPQEIRGY